MYYGKPAVTFTIPGSGVNYVNLNGVTGIECPNGDSKAYAEALIKLGNDKKLREEYGMNARQRVLDNFTQAQFKEKMTDMVERLVRGGVTPNAAVRCVVIDLSSTISCKEVA